MHGHDSLKASYNRENQLHGKLQQQKSTGVTPGTPGGTINEERSSTSLIADGIEGEFEYVIDAHGRRTKKSKKKGIPGESS